MVETALIAHDEARRIDAELLRVSRGMSALRLRIGDALEALATTGGHHQLGFSSLEAFARERCERTGRWAADTRALARRLARLPLLRRKLSEGRIGWSVAELLARHVTSDTERAWLERAGGLTVRELRQLLRTANATSRASTSEGDGPDADELDHLLTVTVDQEDAWYFECARRIADHVGSTQCADDLLHADRRQLFLPVGDNYFCRSGPG